MAFHTHFIDCHTNLMGSVHFRVRFNQIDGFIKFMMILDV